MADFLQYQLLCWFLICMGMSSGRWNYVGRWPSLMLRCIQRALQRKSIHRKKSRDPRPSEKVGGGELLPQLQKKTWTKQVLTAEPKAKDPLPQCQEYLQLDQGKHKYSSGDSLIGIALSGGVLCQRCLAPMLWWVLLPQEFTQPLMSYNLIIGIFQWLDKLKKHTFAIVILSGPNNGSAISEARVLRCPSPDWQRDLKSHT